MFVSQKSLRKQKQKNLAPGDRLQPPSNSILANGQIIDKNQPVHPPLLEGYQPPLQGNQPKQDCQTMTNAIGCGVTIAIFHCLRNAAPGIAPKCATAAHFGSPTPMRIQNAVIRSASAFILHPNSNRKRKPFQLPLAANQKITHCPTRVRGKDHAGAGAGTVGSCVILPLKRPVERTTFAPSKPSNT